MREMIIEIVASLVRIQGFYGRDLTEEVESL